MRRFFNLLFVAVIGIAVFPAAAQDQRTLTYGEPATGTITGDAAGFSYTFQGTKGDSIYISMYAPNYDLTPQVQLLGTNGALIQRVDRNAPVGLILGPITLPNDGTYTVIATRADDSTGDFNLLVDHAVVNELQQGSPMTGSLPAQGAFVFFTFKGEANKLIHYQTSGSNLVFGVLTPSGDPFISDGPGDNLSNFFRVLPESGTYGGGIQTLNPGGTDYSLEISPVEVQPLKSGEPAQGTIHANKPLIFTFDSAAGKMWQLDTTITDKAYSSHLYILNADGSSIAGDNNSGPNGFPRIEPFIAPESATYYVAIYFDPDSSNPDETHDYTLSLAPSTLLSLAPGKAINGQITPDTGNVIYAYSGQENEAIRVTVTRTGDTGRMEFGLRSLDSQLMYLTNYSGVRSASFEIVLPSKGLYLFEILNTDRDNPAMSFTILLEQVK
jgi:hypothetical protein